MGNLSAVLRAELEALEVELAEDPRVRKAAAIRELLEIYEASPDVQGCAPLGTSVSQIGPPAPVKKKTLGFHRIRSTIQIIIRRKRTADQARARLLDMARNAWSTPSSAWLERQANSVQGRDKALPPPLTGTKPEIALESKLATS
jgi:hypothetical protein